VDNKGGTFTLPYSNTGSNPTLAIHLTGKDSSGYSYNDTGSTGNAKLELGVGTKLLADNGVNVSASASDAINLDVNSGTTSSVTLQGKVNIPTGILEIFDVQFDNNGNPLPGTATIAGNLTLGGNTKVKLNWNGKVTQGNYADQIQVDGDLNINGAILDMFGDNRPPLEVGMPVFAVLNNHQDNGEIGQLQWKDVKYAGTYVTDKVVVGTTNNYQIKLTS
jgi:hypothetical protein